MSQLRRLVTEIHRRSIWQVLGIYVVASWIIYQVVLAIFEGFGLPHWVPPTALVLLLIGLPIVLATAFVQDGGASVQPDRGRDPAHGGEIAPQAPFDSGAGPTPPPSPSGGGVAVDAEGRTRLVVLPFRMLRPDEEIEFLSFSLPDAITGSLSGFESLVVRSRIAAMRFAQDAPDLAEIAARAHVDVVVTGTLVRHQDHIRVTAQLTDVSDGTLLWTQAREFELGDLFRLQEELTRSIVASLRLPLGEREQGPLQRDVPATARGYEFYLRANQIAYELGQWQTARDLYVESLDADPSYAPAWARLGRCHRLIGKYASDPAEAELDLTRSREALERALTLNPDLSLAHNLYAQLEVDVGEVEAAMRRLLAMVRDDNPDAEPLAGLVHACRFAGLLDESIAAHRAACRVDPTIKTSVNHTYWMLGDHEAAFKHTKGGGIGYLPGLALAALGREAEAIELLRRNEASLSDDRARAYLRSLRALLEGDREAALFALDTAAGGMLDGEAAYYLARSYARLGESERALTELERVVDAGFLCHVLFERDPWLDGLRGEARFGEWLERAGARHTAARRSFMAEGGGRLLSGRSASPAAPVA